MKVQVGEIAFRLLEETEPNFPFSLIGGFPARLL